MPIASLDHVNIRNARPEASVAFFRDVLDMSVQPAPGTTDLSRGGWVMVGDRAVVHIGHADTVYPSDARVPFDPGEGHGPVHHVAFTCEGHAETKVRLAEHGIAIDENVVAAAGLRQIFLRDPGGVLIELNFWGD
ncbi:VOC family protein [Sphingomonas profundi]|uniref:VOC family protein n=1 Tax=Alterirhizorhabdus profundi TaxID=2681549 RepID=UPI0012E915C9|nr:VOC family protein [Sphingomonas profundi]